jgi:hypothetical protein
MKIEEVSGLESAREAGIAGDLPGPLGATAGLLSMVQIEDVVHFRPSTTNQPPPTHRTIIFALFIP